MPKDVVCGMEVEAKEMKNIIKYKEQIHYFCSERCRTEFVNNPEAYYFIMRRYNWIERTDFNRN